MFNLMLQFRDAIFKFLKCEFFIRIHFQEPAKGRKIVLAAYENISDIQPLAYASENSEEIFKRPSVIEPALAESQVSNFEDI